VGYDKLNRVNHVRGNVYDAAGNLLDKLSKSNVEDVSAFDGTASVTDGRYKIAKLPRSQYPYTVEFEYETTSNNLMFYPVWRPQSDLDLAVERANFQVVMPKALQLRYLEKNLAKPATVTTDETKQIYNWMVSDVRVVEVEHQGPSVESLVPIVYTAPTEFEVERIAGDMSTWQGLGNWQYQTNSGRDQLPEALRQQLIQLTAGEKEAVRKIKKVYEYLQANTRYVSIQLGLGGWQPFDATTVHKNSYGDCKALTNYTQAMLKVIGIESFYTVIKSGSDVPDIRLDFPSRQFNHVVLLVPLPKDTVWLECTSQTNPFGYMGAFTGDRHALAITPQGGKIVRTPVYQAKDNLQNRSADVRVAAGGDATAEVRTVYTALQQEYLSAVIDELNPEDQKKQLYKVIRIPNFDINGFEFNQQKDRIPSVTEQLNLTVRKCASVSGKRLFLTPNLMTRFGTVPPKDDNRQHDLFLDPPYIDTDTIRYHLPEGSQVESQPENVAFESPFGSYAASIKVEPGLVTYVRRHQMNAGKFPKASYPAYVDFCKKMAKADKMQLVLLSGNLAEK
ncbi:MAG: DUF3857 domain-containing protein, partial [Ferruginibacter sp.]|nr:DUF3857 domain-containing protein [Cytophagales bacterium]